MKPTKKTNPSWPRRLLCQLGLHVWDIELGVPLTASGIRRDRRRCRHCGLTQVRMRSGAWVGRN